MGVVGLVLGRRAFQSDLDKLSGGSLSVNSQFLNCSITNLRGQMIPYYRDYHFRKFPHRSKYYMRDKLATKMFLRIQKWQPIIGSWTSRGSKRYVYPVNELLSIRRTLGLDEWFRFNDYTNYRREGPKRPWANWHPKTRILYLKQGRLA